MLKHSDKIGEVMAAIGQVQESVGRVEKDLRNPHYGNTYASLNAHLRALGPALVKHGLVMTQAPGMDDRGVVVETMIYHQKSGQWIGNTSPAPLPKNDPQGLGSALTYLKRYALGSLFALPQEDDDGEAASEREAAPQDPPAAKKSQPPAPQDVVALEELMNVAAREQIIDVDQAARIEKVIEEGDADQVKATIRWIRKRLPHGNTEAT